jgi:TonB family protein
MSRKAFLLVVCLVFLHRTAHADDVKDALSHKYKSRLLAVRSSFNYGDQKFDSNGQRLSAPPVSPWLLYGEIYIEHMSLSSDALSLDGYRIGAASDNGGKPVGIRLGKIVHIEIQLAKPLQSIEEGEAVLNRIFILQGEGADNKDLIKPEDRLANDNNADEKIYEISKGIKPPRAIDTPEPSFSDKALNARLRGTIYLRIVVDKTGRVSRVRLERALGYDMDELAMEKVKTWHFAPALRDGQPVAVAMKLEISIRSDLH